MNHVLIALLLAISVNCATASTRHSIPVDSPYVGLNPADTICLRIARVLQATDSLWASVDHREDLRIAARVIGGLTVELDAALRREQDQRSRADRLASGEGQAFAEVDQLKRDVEFWKRKANGRGWRAFFAGVILGGAAGYGANELRP